MWPLRDIQKQNFKYHAVEKQALKTVNWKILKWLNNRGIGFIYANTNRGKQIRKNNVTTTSLAVTQLFSSYCKNIHRNRHSITNL